MIDHPKQLVFSGLYRYVRNPMYLGVLLFLFGESLFVESWSFFDSSVENRYRLGAGGTL